MSRKRTLLAFFLALVFVGYTARGPIASTFFEWYLKGYCRACLGSRLTYENVHQENGRWVFENPVLTTKKRLEEGGFRFQADQAALKVSIDWLKRSMSLGVNVKNPHLDIGRGAEDLRKIIESPSKNFNLFEVHTKFKVPQGTILFHDFTEEHLIPIPLFFHINVVCKDQRQGCAALWAGNQKRDDEGFLVTFSESEHKEPQINFALQNVECSSLTPVLRGIWPEYNSLDISKGNFSGNVVLTLPHDSPGVASGHINLKDLVILNEKLDLEIAVSEIDFKLAPKVVSLDDSDISRMIGNVSFHPASITLRKNGMSFWSMDGAKGSASFSKDDFADFSLNGMVDNHGKRRHLAINGTGRFSNEDQRIYALDMHLKGDEPNNDINFHFSARGLSDQWSFGEVELLGFGVEELDLVQHIVAQNFPKWQHVHLHQGNIDAAMLVYLKGFHLSEVKVERIAAHRLAFSYNPWDLNAGVESALGSMSFDLSEDDPIKTLNADLKLSQGNLNLDQLDNASWQFSGIDTNLTVQKGVIQKSLFKGTVAGLKGEIELDGTSTGPIAQFNFSGTIKEFAKVLPDIVKKGLDKEFADDRLKISANAKKTGDGLLFKGIIVLETPNTSGEEIQFGFTLNRSSQGLWRHWPPPQAAVDYYSKAGFDAFRAMTPAIAMPMYSAYRHLISQNQGFVGFNLKDGWFLADSLPLEKYISPFLFRNDQMKLGGVGEFSGVFDEQKIVVNYNAKDMILENSDFAIEIKNLSEGLGHVRKHAATYMFDFDKRTSYNGFPIQNATYFEKNSGLLYTEINARLSMEDTHAHFEDLTAFCNGLYFAGSSRIDWSMPGDGVFRVDMRAHEMHGKVSQLQHLLSHLNKNLAFLKIPVEGNIGLLNKGGHLRFSFHNNGYDLESVIQGALTDGRIDGENVDLSLRELNVNFDYNHKANTLGFSDIQGTLLVGKPNHVEEYTLSGDGVRFTDYSRDEAEFDVWIGVKSRDIIRLAGKTRKENSGDGSPYINFLFNKTLSHFGDARPEKFKLAFKDWSQLELFQLTFDFQLKSLLKDLQRFSRSGLFFLSRSILKELNDIDDAKGAFKAELNYDSARSSLNYRISGLELAVGKREFNNFLLSGCKKAGLWSVDQLQLDDFSLAFDVMKEGSIWNINFLGARFGDHLLLGMEGQYSDDDAHLEARINLFEADLGRLNEWPLLKAAVNASSISGQVRTSGVLHAELDKSMPEGMRINLKMNGSLNNAKFNSLHLDDIPSLTLIYDSSKGLAIKNMKIGAKYNDQVIRGSVFLEEIAYNLGNQEFSVDNLHFDIPAENLPWVVNKLQESFPGKMTEPIAEVIRTSKTRGALQGSLNLTSSDDYSSLRLHLNDGQYQFMGREHDVKGFVIDYDPFALKLFTEYHYLKHRLRLDAHSSVGGFDSGEAIVSDLSENVISSNPLTVHWKVHPQTGLYIHQMTGDLSGMAFDFMRDPHKVLSSDSMDLIGKIDIDFRKAKSMFDDQLAARIATLEFGKGYSLAGQLSILKAKSKPLSDSLFFEGEMTGNEFDLYGYRFYNMTAQLSYSPESAFIRGLKVYDNCGNVQIDHMDFFHQGSGLWQVFVPEININNFKPTLITSLKSVPPKGAKSLVIRNINITELNGLLGEKKSFSGQGYLTFANPPKKSLQNTILAVPAELLTRIGLDLAFLTPVRGEVIFDITEGKALLKRFKDVYSKGRLSKFYLADNGIDSYVDFDGNLSLQVRMKQYNIIFKLAELFTVTVQGTLRKPTYTLQKQQKQGEVAGPRK